MKQKEKMSSTKARALSNQEAQIRIKLQVEYEKKMISLQRRSELILTRWVFSNERLEMRLKTTLVLLPGITSFIDTADVLSHLSPVEQPVASEPPSPLSDVPICYGSTIEYYDRLKEVS